MAFIIPFSKRLQSNKTVPASITPRRNASTRPRWTSLAKSHPYGNGGLENVADFTGYDLAEIEDEAAFASAKLLGEEPAKESIWALVMSADVIQWNNNLYQTSVEHGFKWDLKGISVIGISEGAAQDALGEDMSELWVVLADRESLLAVGSDEGGERLVLSFEMEDEAVRFADNLRADGNDEAGYIKIRIEDLKEACEKSGMVIGLVPGQTLVVPSQFRTGW